MQTLTHYRAVTYGCPSLCADTPNNSLGLAGGLPGTAGGLRTHFAMLEESGSFPDSRLGRTWVRFGLPR